MTIFYVYQYINPITKEVFYVGKGKGLRYMVHLKETKKTTDNRKKWAYIKGLRNKGVEPIVEIVQRNLEEKEAYELESVLIKRYGRKGIDPGGTLTNICIDNRPPNMTGHKFSEEAKKKFSEAKRGDRNPSFGVPKSAEWKKTMSDRFTGTGNPFFGKTHSDNEIDRLKNQKSMLGKRHKESTKVRISNALSGIVRSESTRQKIRDARAKQKFSEDTRQKMSIAQKARWNRIKNS